MTKHVDYASFLVRLWLEPAKDPAAPLASWQAEVESIQTGHSWRFTDFGDLMTFLEDALPEGGNDHGLTVR